MNPSNTPDPLSTRLGAALIAAGAITESRLAEVQQRAAIANATLHDLLLAEHGVAETALLESLAAVSGLTCLHGIQPDIGRAVVESVPVRTALHYHIMPVERQGDKLTVVTARVPSDTDRTTLESLLNCRIIWQLATRGDVEASLKHYYGLGAATLEEIRSGKPAGDPGRTEVKAGLDPSDLVREYIEEAIRMRASDIHLDVEDETLRLRVRVDGVMQEIPLPPGVHALHRPLISCIKIMAQLDISERRIPQEGRIRSAVEGRDYDLRVSILPAIHGESVNIRILNLATALVPLSELGIAAEQVATLDGLIRRPHGLVLFTGPTGSGKTTSLYAVLARIRNSTLNIVTLEDPVEYEMEGVTQIQINPAVELNFASGLRSMLRHDPDVILVGEIRDRETAEISIRAAMTGHLVLSTLHTNSAAGTPARLIDMGIEPYLVAFAAEGIIAQRLIRQLCSACRTPTVLDKSLTAELAGRKSATAQLFSGRGCTLCSFTGYRGRIAIMEVLTVTDAIRHRIVQCADAATLHAEAARHGMTSLRDNAWSLALEGRVSVEDVVRLTQPGPVARP